MKKSKLNHDWVAFALSMLAYMFSIQILTIYLTTVKQQAEINYLHAYAKSIETQGLAHWQNWYNLKNSKLSSMTNPEIVEFVFGTDAPLMKRIAKCESGFNSKAENKKSSATGLFQVLSYTHNVNKLYLKDPLINSLIARKLFQAGGTSAWISSVSCWGQE
jgi:hypothetical protein